MFFLIISGCDTNKAEPSTHKQDSIAVKTEPNEIHMGTTLTLNDGKKWKLDEPTQVNIHAIKLSFEKAEKEVDK